VTDRVYQVRGFDISNMTIIEGDNSLIIIDATTTAETAKVGIELYYQHCPRKPVGHLLAQSRRPFWWRQRPSQRSRCRVGQGSVAGADGFMDAVMSESIIAGTAMSRRSQYQFGGLLPAGPRGHVDGGLGKGIAARQADPNPAERDDR
jgi:alkyl sulfatase BDS1-like metallo-beta-lactamase superfamily hydrolase